MGHCRQCGEKHLPDARQCARCGAGLGEDPRPGTLPRAGTPREQQESGFSIAAFILGIFCLIPIVSLAGTPLALLCGIIALVQINRSRGALCGGSRAAWGIALSVLFPAVSLTLLYPITRDFYPWRKRPDPGFSCLSNQRQLALAMLQYATEHDEILPGKDGLTPDAPLAEKQQWRMQDLTGVPRGVYDCKGGKQSGDPGPGTAEYGMNAEVMGRELGKLPFPSSTLLTADVDGADAIFSAAEIAPRHQGYFAASFIDGHVQFIRSDRPRDPPPAGTGILPFPAANPFILQGATNVIEVKIRKWGQRPTCRAYTGTQLKARGDYFSTVFTAVPLTGVPQPITLGTFHNGDAAPSPARIVIPLAPPATQGKILQSCYTFRLPPVSGSSQERGHPAYTGYRMVQESPSVVRIEPTVLP